ncbi:hypothetical protein [Pararhizobium haloflavum]|uniref:hypothetical protein n=1 Tax=Pararhizobium haloflavum TaxID=2037914 RepID=UPI0013000BDE|nr:hypothetical protein [Pararhizobium haloflavum]
MFRNNAVFTMAMLIAVAAVSLLIGPAFAQEAGDTVVGLGGFFGALSPFIAEVAALLVTALVGWIMVRLNGLLGLQKEGKHREALQSALMNGVFAGLHYVEAKADKATIDVRSAVLAEGIRYVERNVPDALKFFKLTPDRVRELLEAKLPAVEVDREAEPHA